MDITGDTSSGFSMRKCFKVSMSASEGLGKVHVITGPGKGKTTAAFGLAMRAAGHGIAVCIIQFMKTGETTGETIAAKRVRGIEVRQFGTGRFVDLKKPSGKDRRIAQEALQYARTKFESGDCQMVILDEVNTAVSYGLISISDVLEAVKSRKEGIEVVLTGRDAPLEFIEYADYVSVIDSWKHPFDEGLRARKGVEW